MPTKDEIHAYGDIVGITPDKIHAYAVEQHLIDDDEIPTYSDIVNELHPEVAGHSPIPATVQKPKISYDYTEVVKNDQGGAYYLVIPVWLVIQDRIFMWDRGGTRYIEITLDKFLEETHQK